MATRSSTRGDLGGGAAADAGAADVGGGIVAEVVGAAADNVNPTGFDEIFTLDNGRYAVDVSPTGETQIDDQATGQTFNGDDFYQVEQEAGIELTGVDALEQTTEADTLRADEANQALDQERAAASNDNGGNGNGSGGNTGGGNGGSDPSVANSGQADGSGSAVNTSPTTPSGGTSGINFVGTTSGDVVPVPESWSSQTANNGQGIIFQDPGATGNDNSIRIMDPTSRYPDGYLRYYNAYGQPLDALGNPGSQAATHLPLGSGIDLPRFYRWLQGFMP